MITIADRPRFVSRGGLKLERALEAFDMPVEGRRCLDVGASTGGFTDCLLRRGAAHVTCVDVGYGELDWRLREDPRVTVLERVNARTLQRAMLPYAPDLVVMDVSFISLAKVLPAVAACARARASTCSPSSSRSSSWARDGWGRGEWCATPRTGSRRWWSPARPRAEPG